MHLHTPAFFLARRVLALVLGTSALVACGSAVPPATDDVAEAGMTVTDASDAATTTTTDAAPADVRPDVPVDVPFVEATHNPLPQVMNHGGPVMHNPRLVLITFADDTNRAAIETFANWIGGSSWLTTVGADYGVGAGTVLGVVERMDNAPSTVTNTQIESMIAAGITDGSIPSPPDHDFSNVLYMVYYPQHTVVTLQEPGGPPSRSCSSFGGYHSEVNMGTVHVSYAEVSDCGGGFGGGDVAELEVSGSHEYIEAATDPLPFSHHAYELPFDGSTAWMFVGGEIGDLCELTHTTYMTDGHYVQRIWSNTAAAMNEDPCIPSDPTRPYFNVSVDPGDVQWANPGDTITFTLTGYSLQPMPQWSLRVDASGGTIDMPLNLSDSVLNNGSSVTVTVTVPDSATSNDYESWVISSSETSPRARQVWPIAVLIN